MRPTLLLLTKTLHTVSQVHAHLCFVKNDIGNIQGAWVQLSFTKIQISNMACEMEVDFCGRNYLDRNDSSHSVPYTQGTFNSTPYVSPAKIQCNEVSSDRVVDEYCRRPSSRSSITLPMSTTFEGLRSRGKRKNDSTRTGEVYSSTTSQGNFAERNFKVS